MYKDLWPLCLIRTFPSKRGNSHRLWERSESCMGVLSLLNNLFRLRQTSPTLIITVCKSLREAITNHYCPVTSVLVKCFRHQYEVSEWSNCTSVQSLFLLITDSLKFNLWKRFAKELIYIIQCARLCMTQKDDQTALSGWNSCFCLPMCKENDLIWLLTNSN